nr:MAG TPA: hypothetical protein [Caudoviricetes sp.]
MKFRFDKIKKEDLRLVDKNLYIRVDNVWYLFVKNAKEFDFDTVYGEGVFAVTELNGTKHVFYTANGFYMRMENVETIIGKYVNAEYLWSIEALIKNSDHASKLFDGVEKVLSEMNGETRTLMSANKYAVRSETNFGLPDVIEYDDVYEESDKLEGDE